jgi:hypothetical protein
MKRMLGTKPLWLFETSCSGGQLGPGRSALLSGTQCAGADVDQGRRPNLSESRVTLVSQKDTSLSQLIRRHQGRG